MGHSREHSAQTASPGVAGTIDRAGGRRKRRKSARRVRGSGSIYVRADGLWCAEKVIEKDPLTGKVLRRKTFYGKTATDVQQKLDQYQADVLGGLIENGRLTVAAYLQSWLTETVKPNRRASTYTSYNRTISQYIAPRIGHVLLSKLTAAHVESLYSALRNDDKKPITGKSLQLVHIVLHAALKRAVRQGRIVRNACAMVDRPRYQPAPRQPLNAEQVRRLLEMANDNRLEALYVLAVFTGVRQGEALGLQWSDIEWQARTASIRRSLQELEDGTVVALEPKTEKSRRVHRPRGAGHCGSAEASSAHAG